jgi:hypothetical protein
MRNLPGRAALDDADDLGHAVGGFDERPRYEGYQPDAVDFVLREEASLNGGRRRRAIDGERYGNLMLVRFPRCLRPTGVRLLR